MGDPLEDEAAGNRKHNFRANAEARIAYIGSDGEQYDVLRSGGSDPARLMRHGTDLGMDVGRRVTVRVFGQRELQTLAQKNEILRDFVAQEAGDDWVRAVAKEKGEMQAIAELDGELLSLETQLAALGDDEQELIDLRDRVTRADTKGAADLIAQSADLTTAATDMRATLAWPEAVAGALEELKAVLPAPSVPALPSNRDAVAAALTALADAISTATEELDTAVEREPQRSRPKTSDGPLNTRRRGPTLKASWPTRAWKTHASLVRCRPRCTSWKRNSRGSRPSGRRTPRARRGAEGALDKLAETRRLKSRLVESAAGDLTRGSGVVCVSESNHLPTRPSSSNSSKPR